MGDSPQNSQTLDLLLEEFLERFRQGEYPSISEYARKNPELAGEIKDLFPTVVMMERVKEKEQPRESRFGGLSLDVIGDFELVREIGRGGMGVVYEAKQTSLGGRQVALKILPSQPFSDRKRLLRFQREAQAAARLHHANIVPVFGVGEFQGTHYYVMQYINGQSLDAVLRILSGQEKPRLSVGGESSDASSACELSKTMVQGKFVMDRRWQPAPRSRMGTLFQQGGELMARLLRQSSAKDDSGALNWLDRFRQGDQRLKENYWRNVAGLGLQVASALHYAHSQNVLHRDVKPGNILVNARGLVWVADFGLAKMLDHQELTLSGDRVGTLRYMAPEQLSGNAEPRSDIYSLGLTLFELLTLKPAFDAVDQNQLIQQVTRGLVPRPRSIRPDIPRDLETIVVKATDPVISRRYETAEDLANDLQAFLQGKPILARRATLPERVWEWGKRNVYALIFFFTSLALIGVLAFTSALSLNQKSDAQHDLDEIKGDLLGLKGEVATRKQQMKSLEQELDRQRQLDRESLLNQLRIELEYPLPPLGSPDLAPQVQAANRLSAAMEFFEGSDRLNPANPETRAAAAKCYHRLGMLRDRINEGSRSQHAFTRSAELYDQLLDEDRSHPRHRWGYVLSCVEVDPQIASFERLADVVVQFQRAAEYGEEHLREFPDEADASEIVARVYLQLGKAFQRMRRYQGAGDNYRRSWELIQRAYEQEPDDLSHLSRALNIRYHLYYFEHTPRQNGFPEDGP